MLLAELNVRHSRRQMPTRRVALGDSVLPTAHPGYGSILLAAIAGASTSGLDDEQAEALPGFLRAASTGLSFPLRALGFRLQVDVEALAWSRHRLLGEDGNLVLELDVSGRNPVPQLLGALMATSLMAPYPRGRALAAIREAIARPDAATQGFDLHLVTEAQVPPARTRLGPTWDAFGVRVVGGDDGGWDGVPAERRWAMEVLGFGPGASPDRHEVLRRFRRLVSLVHPDHSGAALGAAESISELGEARRVLLASGADDPEP